MAASKNASGSAQLSDGRLVFTNLTITDPIIVTEFKSAQDAGADLIDFASSLLDIGARTASLRTNSAGAEKIEASITAAKNSISETAKLLEDAVKKQVKDLASDDGILLESIKKIIETYQDEVEELASGEDSELRKAMIKLLKDAKDEMSKDVKNTVDSQRKALAELLDPSNATSPLKGLAEKVQGVSDAIMEMKSDSEKRDAVEVVLEPGSQGGFAYEDVVVAAVQKIASFAGDDCEPTGKRTGNQSKKFKGDGVVDLKVGDKVFAKVVLEAKNKAFSKKEWESEAAGSKKNRGATGFIGLCKHLSDMPTASRLLILDSQNIIVQYNPEEDGVDLLVLVYQIVKMNTLNASGQLDGLDIAEVNLNLQEALKSLESFNQIGKDASAITNAAKRIALQSENIREEVSLSIAKVQKAISRELEMQAIDGPDDLLELEAE
jgi:hypothetical protein